MVNDTISDFLARIKNGYLAKRTAVSSPYAKILEKIAEIMVKNNYLEKIKIREKKEAGKILKKEMVLTLKYDQKKGAVTEIIRISKPSRRVYLKRRKIKPTLSGYGISIVSTPFGLLTDKEARKKKTGGEIICQIY